MRRSPGSAAGRRGWRPSVLVFPSVNEPGLEVVQALAKSDGVVVFGGSSGDVRYDPSRNLLARHLQCPSLGSPMFRSRFEALLDEHGIDLVFPTVDALVAEFATWNLGGVRFVVTNAATASLFVSKRRTYERLAGLVPIPEAYGEAAAAVLPAFAKPDVASGSRGAFRLDRREEVETALADGRVVQEYLPGEEYTVDCLNDRTGVLRFANVRRRARVGCGISLGTSAETRPDIEEHARRIAGAVTIEGPWFAQFKCDRDGRPKLLEVNARVAGSMTLSRLAGVNIPLLAVSIFTDEAVEVPRRLPGLTLNRCLRNLGEVDDFDWVVWDLDGGLLRTDGKPDPDAIACLYDLRNQGIGQVLLTGSADAQAVLRHRLIPPALFTRTCVAADKLAELHRLFADGAVDAERCIVVNRSASENLAIQRGHPALRCVAPDALETLAREKIR